MNEWGVVGVLVTVIGLFVTVCTPMIKLNTNITKLNANISNLVKRVDDIERMNRDSHRDLWDHNDAQDKQLNDHETRLQIIEKDKNH